MLREIRPELDDSLRSAISDFERRVRSPSLLEALAYARFAKVSADCLVDDGLDLPEEIMNALSKGNHRKKSLQML